MFKLVLGKAEEPEIKLPNSAGSWKKQENSRKTSISALLTMPKPLTVWITINWKILKEMGIPDHLTRLLRNLYTGQEATIQTGHGTTDCFQIGKEVGLVVWYSHLSQNFPQFIVIHIVKGFGIVNKAEIDVFLELSCFFDDPEDVDNLFSVPLPFLKPG